MAGALQTMEVASRPLGDHAPASGAAAIERARAAAAQVAGMRVLHVSAAGSGGEVPEQLDALLPLAVGAGVRAEWRVLFGGAELVEVVSALRHGLQGAESAISDAAWQAYLDACAAAAAGVADEGFDVVVLHDPGALGLAAAWPDETLVWRCHLDASEPDPPAWARARHLAVQCAATAAADPAFAPPGLDGVRPLAPGIDPLSPRNLELAPRLAGRALRRLGIDLDRPVASQLLRLDRWGDPHTALEAFALVREELPELQLVLACEMEPGAEAWPSLKEISDYADGRQGLHLLSTYSGLGNLELGALSQLSRVALRLSLREGIGLAASEAMWRGTPVVGRGAGVALQVRDGVDGYLAEGPEETAARVVELVRDPGLAVEMGQAGRGRVRERFLVTRALEDELRLLAEVG